MPKFFFATAVLILITIQMRSQGPVDGFYRGGGNMDLALGGGMEIGQGFYAGKEEIAFSRDIVNASAFLAYGILDNLDVNISAAYVEINDVQSVQDGSVYLKYRFLQKNAGPGKMSLSLALGYSAPLAAYETEGGNAIGQQAQVFDLRPVLHYQLSSGWFGTLQGGYLLKGDPTPDALHTVIKAGRASGNFYFDVYYAYQKSDGGLNYRGEPAPLSFRELGTDYNKVGASVYKPLLDYFGLALGANYTFSGRNIGKAIGLNGSVVFKLNTSR